MAFYHCWTKNANVKKREDETSSQVNRGSRNRTRIDGFGDRFPTIRRFPYIYEYKEPVARFLSGAVRTLKTAYTCCRLDGGLTTAFLLTLRKRVTRRSLRSRLHVFASQMSRNVRSRRPVQARPPLTYIPAAFSAFGQALVRLVTVSSIHYCTSTPVLSTSSSSRGLTSSREWEISSWRGLHA